MSGRHNAVAAVAAAVAAAGAKQPLCVSLCKGTYFMSRNFHALVMLLRILLTSHRTQFPTGTFNRKPQTGNITKYIYYSKYFISCNKKIT